MGRSLFDAKAELSRLILSDPIKAIEVLKHNYFFGSRSDFWDDHVFNSVVAPALSTLTSQSLETAINIFSHLDHLLFLPYVRRDEDPTRFRRAFWNLNHFGLKLSQRFFEEHGFTDLHSTTHNVASLASKKRIAFVFKGAFSLAHAEFLREFLVGSRVFAGLIDIYLVLLDQTAESVKAPDLEHINIVSLSEEKHTYSKLVAYAKLIQSLNLDHVSWVACVQNISLYMGSRFAKKQSYWSMKYHSIIMSSLDKYAGLGFGGDCFEFDDIRWFRGRAFPDLSLPQLNRIQIGELKKSINVSDKDLLLGCFVRSEKLNNIEYWRLIQKILSLNPRIHFVIASQNLPAVAQPFLQSTLFQEQFHPLGWVDTKKWCQCLDIYLDSFPRGSCLTALEAIKAQKPVIIFDTEHNRESSALPYLSSVADGGNPEGLLPVESIHAIFNVLLPLLNDCGSRKELAKSQARLLSRLEGGRNLFAKDYLNYFLDTSFTLEQVLAQ